MNFFGKFRIANWAVIVLCFFLPFSRGCNNEIHYLNIEALEGWKEFLTRGLPVLYPLVLMVCGYVVSKFNEKHRLTILRYIYISWALFFSWFTYIVIDSFYQDLVKKEMLAYIAILILLWGLMMFGWVKAKIAPGYQKRIAFSITALSCWFFPIMVFLDKQWLIGAWAFIIATALVLLSYLTEYAVGRKAN
jgi:hypothetical protein